MLGHNDVIADIPVRAAVGRENGGPHFWGDDWLFAPAHRDVRLRMFSRAFCLTRRRRLRFCQRDVAALDTSLHSSRIWVGPPEVLVFKKDQNTLCLHSSRCGVSSKLNATLKCPWASPQKPAAGTSRWARFGACLFIHSLFTGAFIRRLCSYCA